eukprot:COSAG05_NODE_50_length_24118_cov_89.534036_7_plen_81_part_00
MHACAVLRTLLYLSTPQVDLDISSSYMAGKILSVVQGYAASLVIDLGFVVEGREPNSELPEQLLAGLRLHHMRMETLPVG